MLSSAHDWWSKRTSGIKMPATAAIAKRECTSSACTYLHLGNLSYREIMAFLCIISISFARFYCQFKGSLYARSESGNTSLVSPLECAWVLSEPEGIKAV